MFEPAGDLRTPAFRHAVDALDGARDVARDRKETRRSGLPERSAGQVVAWGRGASLSVANAPGSLAAESRSRRWWHGGWCSLSSVSAIISTVDTRSWLLRDAGDYRSAPMAEVIRREVDGQRLARLRSDGEVQRGLAGATLECPTRSLCSRLPVVALASLRRSAHHLPRRTQTARLASSSSRRPGTRCPRGWPASRRSRPAPLRTPAGRCAAFAERIAVRTSSRSAMNPWPMH